ncbi:MAG: glycosyltransferase family 4 protein [Tardiphaga sp.]
MTRKRVLIVYRSYFPSQSHLGPATAIRNLVTGMAADYDFHILTLNHEFADGTPLFPVALHREMQGSVVVEYIPRGWSGLRILAQRLRDGFDVVDIQCAFDPLLSIPALILCKLGYAGRSRVCHTPHGIFMDVIMSAGTAKKTMFCRLTDLFGLYRDVTHLAGSPGEETDIRRRHRRAQNVRMVSQFVEASANRPVPRDKPAGRLDIAFVGRVTEQKNLIFALDTLRQLPFPTRLHIFGDVGDSAYARQCIAMSKASESQCRVTFCGTLAKDALFARLPHYDLLLHPTLGENFGHSIVEALAMGVPVLISDRSPWTDVADSHAGWALPLSQQAGFIDRLRDVYEMGEAWSAMSKGALRYYRTTFDPNRTAARYREAYG